MIVSLLAIQPVVVISTFERVVIPATVKYILTGTAIEPVISGAPVQRVVSAITVKLVYAPVPVQLIGVRATGEVIAMGAANQHIFTGVPIQRDVAQRKCNRIHMVVIRGTIEPHFFNGIERIIFRPGIEFLLEGIIVYRGITPDIFRNAVLSLATVDLVCPPAAYYQVIAVVTEKEINSGPAV